MNALILDCETTGFSAPEPIEVAWVRLNSPAELLVLEARTQRFKPSKPIELGALATHHIMDEDLAASPPSSSFALPEDVEYLVGHNIAYDAEAIGWTGKTICTCALSRHFWPDCGSHTLSAMLYHLHRAQARDLLKNAHSAADDVENCLLLLRTILREMGPATWEDVWQFCEMARVPKKLTFGKHKGKAIADVPLDYRAWLVRQPDVDPYLARALMA